jgi:hypothetical protein
MWESESEQEWEVEQIVDKIVAQGRVFYRVKCVGYAVSDNTWKPEKNFANSQGRIGEYEAKASLAQAAAGPENQWLRYYM